MQLTRKRVRIGGGTNAWKRDLAKIAAGIRAGEWRSSSAETGRNE